ncbi:hypothetical protein [Deinococcus hohokamensis]
MTRQRDAMETLRVWLTETVDRQDKAIANLKYSLAEFREMLRQDGVVTRDQAIAGLKADVVRLREAGERNAEAGEATQAQHSAELQRILSENHNDIHRVLEVHGSQLDHLTEGIRVIAEVVSSMAEHFPDSDESAPE